MAVEGFREARRLGCTYTTYLAPISRGLADGRRSAPVIVEDWTRSGWVMWIDMISGGVGVASASTSAEHGRA